MKIKRILPFVIFFIYVISTYSFIKIFEMKNISLIGANNKNNKDEYSYLVLEDMNLKDAAASEELVYFLHSEAKKFGLDITRTYFKPKLCGKRKIIAFCSRFDVSRRGVSLVVGRFLRSDDPSELDNFVSSEITKSPQRVGQVRFFSLDTELEIRPFEAINNFGILPLDCKFNTTDKEVLSAIKTDLLNKFGGKIKFITGNKYGKDDGNSDYYNFLEMQTTKC